MTAPVIEVGEDRISVVRGLLHDMLLAHTGLDPARVHRFPQFGGSPTPCAWVGLVTVTDPTGRGPVLEAPLVLAADGREEQQVADLDGITAAVWDAVRTVEAGGGKATTTGSSIDRIGPDGSTTFALTITVRVPLAVRTLCPQSVQLDQP